MTCIDPPLGIMERWYRMDTRLLWTPVSHWKCCSVLRLCYVYNRMVHDYLAFSKYQNDTVSDVSRLAPKIWSCNTADILICNSSQTGQTASVCYLMHGSSCSPPSPPAVTDRTLIRESGYLHKIGYRHTGIFAYMYKCQKCLVLTKHTILAAAFIIISI